MVRPGAAAYSRPVWALLVLALVAYAGSGAAVTPSSLPQSDRGQDRVGKERTPVDGPVFDVSLQNGLVFIDRTGSDEGTGVVGQVIPGVRFQRRGSRASADVNYRMYLSAGTGDTDVQGIAHDLTAEGRIEAIEDLLFVGAQASASLIGDSGTTGSVDSINLNSENGTQTYALKVTPALRPRGSNPFARFVSENVLDIVEYSDSTFDGSTSYTLNAGVVSGPYFDTSAWDVGATHNVAQFENRDDERNEVSGGLVHTLNSRWKLLGRIGYEDNDILTRRSDTDGLIWSVGTDWAPSRRTRVELEYGERYFGATYSAKVSHRTKRMQLGFEAGRSVDNARNQRFVDSFLLLRDTNGNIIVDPVTGDPVRVNVAEVQTFEEDYISTEARAVMVITGRLTRVQLSALVANRDYEFTDDEEDEIEFALRVSRRLASGMFVDVFGNLSHLDQQGFGASETRDIGIALRRPLSARTSLQLGVRYREGEGDNADDDYKEHRVSASVITRF